MEKYDEEGHINVGSGEDVTIKELAETIEYCWFNGGFNWDTDKPNGTPRNDVDRIKSLGWEPKISQDGIESTYQWYLNNDEFKKYNTKT